MPRPAGAKNKTAIIKTDTNVEFLYDVLQGHAKWIAVATEKKTAGVDNTKELEYAEAYKVLLNKFSQLETE